MPIVTQCTTPGCETLTIGPRCVDHEQVRPALLVRGRPWTAVSDALLARARGLESGHSLRSAWTSSTRSPLPTR